MSKSPYEIKALHSGASAEIYIYGDIGESFWDEESVGAAEFVRELNQITADEITVRINSYGGSVADGIAIYNAIQRHPSTITVEIDAVAMSAASLIAMAGDVVNMSENALFMVHAPMSGGWGNAKELRGVADMLDKYADAMLSSYANKTGQSTEDIESLLKDGEDHYYTAQEAMDFGFVDAISEPVKIAASGIPSERFSPPAAWVAANNPTGKTPMSEPKKPAAKKPAAKPDNVDTTVASTQPDSVAAAAPAGPTKDQVLAAEKQRRESIRASFNPFVGKEGVQALMDTCLDDHTVTAEAASQKILAHLGSLSEPLAGSGNIQVGQTERERFVEGASKSILARVGVEKHDGSNEYRGMTMMDMARASLEMSGDYRRGMDKRELVAAAFTQSSSDFPVLLENVMHKALLSAYAETPDTWSRFCKRGEVSDFRAHKRYRVGSFGNLDSLTELGEYKNKSIPDGEAESITASTKGNIVNISRQAIINDDLGAFIGLGQNLARAGKRTIEADVYALLASNPALSDTVALFHATHSNLAGSGSGAALSVATLDAGRVAMGSQTGIGDGDDILDLEPKILVCSKSAGGNARVLVSAQYDPDTANKLQKPNMVNGIVDDIVDSARISGTEWYLFADPMVAPVIEVAFLDGIDEPFLDVKEGWGVDGAQYKVRLDYAVGAIDYRGAWKNAGS